MDQLNKYYCIKAFSGLEIKPNGQASMCCDMNNQKVNIDPYYLNLNSLPLADVVNNTGWQEIRQNMIDNKPSDACEQCYVNERLGITSQRQNSNRRFASEVDYHWNNSGATTHDLIDLDMKIGNVCNQMCVVCDSASSSMLLSEDQQIFGTGNTFKVKWWRNEKLWDQLLDRFESVQRINIYGGEPLLIPEVKKFLLRVVEHGYASTIDVNFATNGSIYNEEFFDILENFNKRTILASADGHKQTFEYSRYPAKWDEFLKNIHLIKQRLDPDDFFANAYTYSAYTVFDLVDTLEFYRTQLDFDFPVWLNPVWQSFYKVDVLPSALKNKLIQDIKQTYNTDYNMNGSKDLSPIVTSLIQHSDEKNWHEFKRITKMRDKMRNISIIDVIPELEDYWHED